MIILKNCKYKFVLFIILLNSAFLNFWGSWNEGWSNAYYSASIKSMLSGWNNFLFASFDPAGFVSVDKPILGLWLQCLSASVFGYRAWALILPQALASVISVYLLYKMVEKPFGKEAGLLAALSLSITPIFVAVGRTNNLDATLIMLIMLASYFALKSVYEDKLRFLLLSAVFVGMGYNVKMLQAFMVLPAIYLLYLICSTASLKKRILHITASTVLLLAVSLSWCIAVDLTPKDQRPYVGSSLNNSEIELAVGYNGIMRILPGKKAEMVLQTADNPASDSPVKQHEGNGSAIGSQNTMPGAGPMNPLLNSKSGFTKLFQKELGGQIAWFLPFALLGLLSAGISLKKRSNISGSRERRISFLFWGCMFIILFFYFSFGGIVHEYYTAMIAPSIAAVSAIGLYEAWRLFKGNTYAGWILPGMFVLTGVVQFILLVRYSDWNSWLPYAVLLLSIFSSCILAFSKLNPKQMIQRFQKFIFSLCIAVLLISPALWSLTPLFYGTSPVIPVAGPELSAKYMSRKAGPQTMFSTSLLKDKVMMELPELEKYLLRNYAGEKYYIAVPDAMSASMLIIDTNVPVVSKGGFTGTDRILTVDMLEKMVTKGELRYYVLIYMPGQTSAPNNLLDDWVKQHGREVPGYEWKDPAFDVRDHSTPLAMFENSAKLYDLKISK